jgi:colicin import membrane protein
MPIDMNTLPRAAMRGYLYVLRLPLDALEAFSRRGDDESWPPAVAFEAFEAQVKTVTAALLRDDGLRQEAALQRARVTQLRRAAELEVEADTVRTEAEDELAQRRQEAEAAREEAAQRADEAEARVRREKAAAETRVRGQAAQAQRKVRETAQAKRDRIAAEKKAARARQLRQERAALAKQKRAVAAKGAVLELDKAADATRRRRRASS